MLTLQAIFMELSIFSLGLVLILLKLISKKDAVLPYSWITAIWFAVTGCLGYFWRNDIRVALNGMYFTDDFSLFFKLLILVCAVLVALGSEHYVKKLGYREAEYYILLSFTTLGMMVFTAAGDLLTLYAGLEVMTMSFIVLIGFVRRNNIATEASFKYLILSALSSAVMLYGMSLMYGFMGTTIFVEMAMYRAQFTQIPLYVLGLIFFLSGFAYKLSAVPFHMWAPDIYQGAPTPVAGFLAVGSKVATLGILCRMMFNLFPDYAETWIPIVLLFAMLSIVFGNLAAIPQRDVKRMLAYSSIAQVGYLLLGVVAANSMGIVALSFYVTVYAFANLGAFIAAAAMEARTGTTDMNKFVGMSKRSPFLAAAMFVFMISLGGLPPMGGFVGKFLLFTATIKSGYLIIAIIALLFSMISVYYYFSLVRKLYFAPVEEGVDLSSIKSPFSVKLSLGICILMSVALGIFFDPIVQLANTAMKSMLLMM